MGTSHLRASDELRVSKSSISRNGTTQVTFHVITAGVSLPSFEKRTSRIRPCCRWGWLALCPVICWRMFLRAVREYPMLHNAVCWHTVDRYVVTSPCETSVTERWPSLRRDSRLDWKSVKIIKRSGLLIRFLEEVPVEGCFCVWWSTRPRCHMEDRDWSMTLTDWLTDDSMEHSPSWEATQEITRILWNWKVHHRMHNSQLPVPVVGQIDSVRAPHPTSGRSILMLSSHLRLGLPSARLLVIFRNMIHFLRWEVVITSPNPQAGGPPLSAVGDCLFKISAATLHIWRPFLHPQPEDATPILKNA
jgi:hypothetical protein